MLFAMQDQDIYKAATVAARPVTWGVVGAGTIAHQFAADLAHVAGARIGAVCSRSEESAQAFMAAAGIRRYCATLPELLADETIDAIYIATPNHLHAGQTREALAAGKPVLVEKPLATSSRDAARVVEAAAHADRFAMEALWTRFLPAVEAVRGMLAAGAIGEVRHVEAELAYRKEEKGGRFFDPAMGGGAALDLGVYPLSLALDLFGRPEKTSGRWWAAGTGVDRRTDFQLSFAGVTAMLSCCFDRDGRNTFTILGSRGAIRIEAPFLKAQQVTLFGQTICDWPLVGARGATSGPAARILSRLPLPGRQVKNFRFPGHGLQFETAAAIDAMGRGERQSPRMPLGDSVAVLEIIETVLGQPPQPA
ncbi:Gfo/Idh/MocA family protein [Kumtagia ephedrae]|nr:Gfo/Idh/MocA family oxidoreductase [Mesorhizobium ephedrae]